MAMNRNQTHIRGVKPQVPAFARPLFRSQSYGLQTPKAASSLTVTPCADRVSSLTYIYAAMDLSPFFRSQIRIHGPESLLYLVSWPALPVASSHFLRHPRCFRMCRTQSYREEGLQGQSAGHILPLVGAEARMSHAQLSIVIVQAALLDF